MVLHSAGFACSRTPVFCDTRGVVVSFSLSQDSLIIDLGGNRFEYPQDTASSVVFFSSLSDFVSLKKTAVCDSIRSKRL